MGDVLAGLRMLPGRLGISPFLAVFKQSPYWVGDRVGGLDLGCDIDTSDPDVALLAM